MYQNLKPGNFIKTAFTLIATFLAFTQSAEGQERAVDTVNVSIYFKAGSAEVDRLVSDDTVESFSSLLDGRKCLPVVCRITGFDSPDNGTARNNEIISRRIETVMAYMTSRYPNAGFSFETVNVGADWERFSELLSEDGFSGMIPGAVKLKETIDTTPLWITRDGKVVDGRAARCRRLLGGRPWRRSEELLFPLLRRTDVECIAEKTEKNETKIIPRMYSISGPIAAVSEDCPAIRAAAPETVPAKTPEKIRLFDVRTNLLLPLLNVGVEIPTKGRNTIGFDIYYPWFAPVNEDAFCAEMLAARVGSRWWFRKRAVLFRNGRNTMTGPCAGISALGGYFDFGNRGKGDQGEMVGGSADFGWAWELGRRGIRLELCAGIGAVYVQTRTYETGILGRLVNRDNILSRNIWMGPTRLELTLNIPIKK